MTAGPDWAARALDHVWHPCTQMQDHEWLPLVPIASGEGVWLRDVHGKPYLDAISSWWTCVFGHRHPHIVERIKTQLDRLDHVMFAGFTHEPAVVLAEKLCAVAPEGLTRVFYADIGSASVEVALKMSMHYWRNRGQPKKTNYIALENGYHGETLGALAVGGSAPYREPYESLLMKPVFVPSPDCHVRAPGTSWEDHSRRQFRFMEEALQRHAETTAAVILEPLVQGAAGMRMYHPVYLQLLREACDRYGVHLILDEIAVGFGRTGRMFASDWVAPSRAADGTAVPFRSDFMCLSKGLTGGSLALACVMTTEDVYQAFYADYGSRKSFMHSHTFTGNPLACAAGVAALEIFAQEDWTARNRRTAALMWEKMNPLMNHPHVSEVRAQGMILAVELVKNAREKTPYPAGERRGLRVYQHGLNVDPDFGVLLRPLGDVIYFMPPYVIEPQEVELMCRMAIDGIERATAN